MTGTDSKNVLIVAGPNGAGKTTFAMEYLTKEANCPIFINADRIAAGLSPFDPDLAGVGIGRLVLNRIHEHARMGDSFAFETALSGRGYARLIPQWQEQGYLVELFFLRLPSTETAIERVARRVSEGGHAVPDAVIRRRFHVGWRNFETVYRNMVNRWALYDNSGNAPTLLERGNRR